MMNLRLNQFEQIGFELIMVLDGPEKPAMKRDKYNNFHDDYIWVSYLIEICNVRGINVIKAEGEGEAECARLQLEGKVDWVFSNDSDCLVFGATKVVYFTDTSSSSSSSDDRLVTSIVVDKEEKLGFSDFIFYALVVGGDYDTKGVCKFGSKYAFELITNSSIGKEFGELVGLNNNNNNNGRSSPDIGPTPMASKSLQQWKEKWNHEIATNESALFSRKNPSKVLPPESFPDERVLKNYINPAVNRVTRIKEQPFLNINRLWLYFESNFPYVGYEMYREFCNMFAVSILVRRIVQNVEEQEMYTIVRKIRGQHTGKMRLVLNLDSIMTPINYQDFHNKSSNSEKGPTTERDVWRFILEKSKNNLLVEFDENQAAKLSTSVKKNSAASASASGAATTAASKNRSINEFFATTSSKPEPKQKLKTEGKNDDDNSSLLIQNVKPIKSTTELNTKPRTSTTTKGVSKKTKKPVKNNSVLTQFFTTSRASTTTNTTNPLDKNTTLTNTTTFNDNDNDNDDDDIFMRNGDETDCDDDDCIILVESPI